LQTHDFSPENPSHVPTQSRTVIILITILPLFLLWTARKSFATLLR
jgi:hypothetical protein